MIELSFTLTRGQELTSNQRLHYHAKADRTRSLRERAAWEARNHAALRGHARLQYPVHVLATIGYPSRRRSDPDNYHPTVKALIDGIVQAGLLEDDDHRHVSLIAYTRDPNLAPKGTHTVKITIKEAP